MNNCRSFHSTLKVLAVVGAVGALTATTLAQTVDKGAKKAQPSTNPTPVVKPALIQSNLLPSTGATKEGVQTVKNATVGNLIAPATSAKGVHQTPGRTLSGSTNPAKNVPANAPRGGGDACGAAVAIGDGSFPFDTTGATQDATVTCGFNAVFDEWYDYTAPANGNTVWSTCGGTTGDTVLAVFSACGGSQLVCLDDSCGLQTSIAFATTAGTHYRLRMAGYNSTFVSGTMTVTNSPTSGCTEPANGCCANATVASVPSTNAYDLAGLANDWPGTCGGTATAEDCWFVATAPSTGTMVVSTCGLQTNDTVISILDECGGPQVLCLDDFCGLQTEVTFPVVAGEDYYIRMADFVGGTHAGSVSIAMQTACVLTPPPGGIPEGEGCGNDTNGGCNMPVPTYGTIACGGTVLGTAFANGALRDTDWYQLTLPGPTQVTLTGQAQFPWQMFVLNDSCPAAIVGIATGASCATGSVTATVPGSCKIFFSNSGFAGNNCGADNDYWMQVTTCTPVSGAPNDLCANAEAISGPGVFPYDNTVAGQDGLGDPLCLAFGTDQITNDVWFDWTSTCNAGDQAILDFCGQTGSDTKVAVYDGNSCVGPILACNDDSCGLQSRVRWNPTPGNVYKIRVGNFPGGAGGPGTFTIACAPCPPCGTSCGTCCPTGTAVLPVTYVYQIDGFSAMTPSTIPWSISFSCGCLTLGGMTDIPADACGIQVAYLMTGDINHEADMMGVGHIIHARYVAGDYDAGCSTCPGGYLLIDVFGDAACVPCPMTFCVGAAMCCMPPAITCVPTPPAPLSFTQLQPLCADCDGNGVDDLVDDLTGELTDVNNNNVFDQCEGFVPPSPLGFPITAVAGTPLTLGTGSRVRFSAPAMIEQGLSASAPGFESFAFDFASSLAGAVANTSDIWVRGHGYVNAIPNAVRGVVRLRVNNPATPLFGVFADYTAINAAQLRITLHDAMGGTLDTLTVANNIATQLATFGPRLPQVEIDAVIPILNSCMTERGAVLRFAVPSTVTITGHAATNFVHEVHIVAVGPMLRTMGAFDHATLTARQLTDVAATNMVVGQFGGTRFDPGAQTIMTGGGGSGGEPCSGLNITADSKGYSMTVDTKCMTYAKATLDSPQNFAICGVWSAILCLKTTPLMGPTTYEEVDPLDFFKSQGSQAGGVKVNIPQCVSLGSAICNAPCISFRQGHLDSFNVLTYDVNWTAITADSAGEVGTVGINPTALEENLSNNRSCIVVTFDARAGQVVPFVLGSGGSIPGGLPSWCPPPGPTSIYTTGTTPLGATYRPAMQALQIRFEGTTTVTSNVSVAAIKLRASNVQQLKVTSVTYSNPGGGSDFNHDGFTNSQDFFDFLVAFFSNSPPADFNCDAVINSQDFFDFISCFFTLC